MPFTVNVGPYQGGNFLFQGMNNLGEGIGKGIQQYQQAQQDEAADQILFKYAVQQGALNTDEQASFLNGSRSQKNGIIAGVVRQFALEQAKQEMQAKQMQLAAQEEQRRSMADLRAQQAAAFSFAPSDEQKALARATGNEIIQTGPGKWQVVPYGGNDSGQEAVITDPLTINGKTIPGIGVNRKTGQYVYFGGMQGGGVQIEVDPRTGVPFYRDAKGNPKPISGPQIMGGQMLPQANAPAQPQAQGGGTLDNILGMIRSGLVSAHLGAAAPSPTPTPSPAPGTGTLPQDLTSPPLVGATGATGVAPGYGVQLSPQDQQALDWAKAHPSDPRSAKILAKLGIQ
jgi:hypothetical protein